MKEFPGPQQQTSDQIAPTPPPEGREDKVFGQFGFDFPFNESQEGIVAAIKANEEVHWAFNPHTKKIKVWTFKQDLKLTNPVVRTPYIVEPDGFKAGSYGTIIASGFTWEPIQKDLTYATLAKGIVADRDEEKDTQVIRDIEEALSTFVANL